jgi:lipopolysaccharide export LptBFGC system permease protein LptF
MQHIEQLVVNVKNLNLKKMNQKLLKILETLKEDFEMLEDGSWDLNYSDGSEIQASIDNVDKAIEIVNKELYGK